MSMPHVRGQQIGRGKTLVALWAGVGQLLGMDTQVGFVFVLAGESLPTFLAGKWPLVEMHLPLVSDQLFPRVELLGAGLT